MSYFKCPSENVSVGRRAHSIQCYFRHFLGSFWQFSGSFFNAQNKKRSLLDYHGGRDDKFTCFENSSEILRCNFTEVSWNFQAVLSMTSKEAHGMLWNFPKILEHSRKLCFVSIFLYYSNGILLDLFNAVAITRCPLSVSWRKQYSSENFHDFSAQWLVRPSVNNLHMTTGSFR